jgi:hypothetical protein
MILLAVLVKAQSAVVINNGCQPVLIALYGDPISSCGGSSMTSMYYLAPKTTLKVDMYPGGPYVVANWYTAPPAGSQFTAIKVYDPSMIWANIVGFPCMGAGTSFGPEPGCGIQATSNWSNPSLIVVNLF